MARRGMGVGVAFEQRHEAPVPPVPPFVPVPPMVPVPPVPSVPPFVPMIIYIDGVRIS